MRTILIMLALLLPAFAQEHDHSAKKDGMSDCPLHAQHMAQSAKQKLDARGESTHGMGFSHSATTHHFLIMPEGGAIQVTANSADDAANIAAIRNHLAHIAQAFQAGDFETPMFVHDTKNVPGIKTMKKLKQSIIYQAQELPNGARVNISAGSDAAKKAIRDFLAFQIREHETGDPLPAQ